MTYRGYRILQVFERNKIELGNRTKKFSFVCIAGILGPRHLDEKHQGIRVFGSCHVELLVCRAFCTVLQHFQGCAFWSSVMI